MLKIEDILEAEAQDDLGLAIQKSYQTPTTSPTTIPVYHFAGEVLRFDAYNPTRLQSWINQFGPLPTLSTILGICEDGLPLLLDLSDPRPGCIALVSDDQPREMINLIKALLFYSGLLNSPDEVSYYLISPNPGLYDDLSMQSNCLEIYSSYDRAAHELVIQLAEIGEQRKSGRNLGAQIILGIDHLYELTKLDDYDVNIYLRWLFRNGSRNGIWPISIIQQGTIPHIDKRIIHEIQTYITNTNNPSLINNRYTHGENANQQTAYSTRINGQTVRFWLPQV